MTTPIKFLGATVSQYSATIGWDGQESTLDVTLVEDGRDDDMFHLTNNVTFEGMPAYFQNGGFTFGGIIQNWQQRGSVDGYPVYSVVISDPRLFFEGISLILDGYTGQITTPNVFNIYGYLENKHGFGGSGKNEAGMSAVAILSALNEMSYSNLGGNYSGGVYFRGVPYFITTVGIPTPNADLRISGDIISFTDLLNEIAEATSSTYFVSLEFYPALGWTILLTFLSRASSPIRGSINRYVASTDGASVKSNGIELVNEVTTKFLFGGKKTDMYAQFYKDGYTDKKQPKQLNINRASDNSYDNPIWHYVGKDLNGNLSLTYSNYSSFQIDARNVNVNGLQPIYNTDITEMRAAISSQDTWQNFLIAMWPFEYYPNIDGDEEDYIYVYAKNTSTKDGAPNEITTTTYEIKKGTLKYTHSGVLNPHFKKAIQLQMDGATGEFWTTLDSIGFGRVDASVLEKFQKKLDNQTYARTNVEELYNLVRNFAEENYGRKYVITIPTVKTAQEPDTGLFRYDMLPTEGGYLDESVWAKAANLNLLPFNTRVVKGKKVYDINTNPLMMEDGRIGCYIRFDNPGNVDLSELNKADVIYGSTNSVFLRCEISPDLEFINNSNKTGARAIITLPNRIVYAKVGVDKFVDFLLSKLIGNLYEIDSKAIKAQVNSSTDEQILGLFKSRFGMDRNTVPGDYKAFVRKMLKNFSSHELNEYFNIKLDRESDGLSSKLLTGSFASTLNSDFISEAAIPNMVAIPLESQTQFYGPWISSIGTGKTQVERDDNLVPWNFNGYDVLNAVANASVNEISGNMVWSESGSLELPGAPNYSLGQHLLQNGPYISDINVSFGVDGVTTTYRMNSWTPKFTKMSRTFIEKVNRIAKRTQENQRAIRETLRLRVTQ